ncbi:hypothetical protein IPJ72_07410 [Candidatus Peregrinibacteria bacterium]|nr:MAG: hypothetical protein IPJ72_07410 [Candidatus Peregrinibacteria bacterium]
MPDNELTFTVDICEFELADQSGTMTLEQIPKSLHQTADRFRLRVEGALNGGQVIFPLEEPGSYSAIEQASTLFNAINTQRLTFEEVLAQKVALDRLVMTQ